MDAETNTGQADEMSPKPIDLQNDFEQSQNAFESLLAGPQEDTPDRKRRRGASRQ